MAADGAPLTESEQLDYRRLVWGNYSGPGELTVIEYAVMRDYVTDLAEEVCSMSYNGWSNRETWAMALNLGNDEYTYHACEAKARYAAVGNESDPEAFHRELVPLLRELGHAFADDGLLPDFTVTGPDPDDITQVDWEEIAEGYQLSEYV